MGFLIYAKFLSCKLFWALYLILPTPPFSLISVCWLISDVSCTSKRFLTTMKVEGQVVGVGWGGVGWGVEGNDIWVQIVLTSKVWFCVKKVMFETMKAMNKILW